MSEDTNRKRRREGAGPRVLVPKAWRVRDVRLPDDTWDATYEQANAELRAGLDSAPSLIVDRVLREYFNLAALDTGIAGTNRGTGLPISEGGA